MALRRDPQACKQRPAHPSPRPATRRDPLAQLVSMAGVHTIVWFARGGRAGGRALREGGDAAEARRGRADGGVHAQDG